MSVSLLSRSRVVRTRGVSSGVVAVSSLATGTSFTGRMVIDTGSESVRLSVSVDKTVSVSDPLKFRLPV